MYHILLFGCRSSWILVFFTSLLVKFMCSIHSYQFLGILIFIEFVCRLLVSHTSASVFSYFFGCFCSISWNCLFGEVSQFFSDISWCSDFNIYSAYVYRGHSLLKGICSFSLLNSIVVKPLKLMLHHLPHLKYDHFCSSLP